MCTDCSGEDSIGVPTLSRRGFLGASLAVPWFVSASRNGVVKRTTPGASSPTTTIPTGTFVGGTCSATLPTATKAGDLSKIAERYGLLIHARSEWGANLPKLGELVPETPKYLLVHHTASTNNYTKDGVARQIQAMFRFHTGKEKGWPDVAYNFFVDRFGGVWEARTGSLAGPVRGDATGGNQGSSVLCCMLGDFSTAPPPEAARMSMVTLLSSLADRYGINTAPGSTATFISRRSNRWPAGSCLTTTTISGHRQMSLTTCPGDGLFDLVQNDFPRAVTELRARKRA